MLLLKKYHPFLLATVVFLSCEIVAIVCQLPLLLVIPFAWLAAPFVVNFCINKTANLFWILLFTLPFSTELNITPALGIDFPDETILILLTGLCIAKLLHEPKWFPITLYKQPLFFIVLLMMGCTLLTALYSDNSILALKFFAARTWYIIPLVILPQILVQSQKDFTKIALLLLIPMVLLVVQTLVRFSFYGFAFESVKKTIFPFFRNHVNYSAMLVCLIPVGLSMYYLTPKANPNKNRILAGIIIGLVGLFFAYSRGAWLALLVGVLFVLVVQKKLLKGLIASLVFITLVGALWLSTNYHYMRFAPDHDRTIFHTDFSEHMAATVSLKDVSNAERFHRWVAGFRMFAARPITGFGANSFYNNYQPYTANRFKTWVSNNPEHSTVHNYFLLTLLEQGIFGLLLFCCLYIGMLFKAQSLYFQLQRVYYRIVALTIGVILSMIGVLIFMSDLIETDKVGSLFWLSLGLLFVLDTKLSDEKSAIA